MPGGSKRPEPKRKSIQSKFMSKSFLKRKLLRECYWDLPRQRLAMV